VKKADAYASAFFNKYIINVKHTEHGFKEEKVDESL
jgi:hypothetical protein